MILLWNRREVYMGNSMEKFDELRGRLEANNIKYTYRLVNNDNIGLFGTRSSQMGSFGENILLSIMYYIYVHKKDYELALYYLNNR